MKSSVVIFSGRAEKSIDKLPKHILKMLELWELIVEKSGYYEMIKIPGYHDHPLKGQLFGLRAVSLNRSYRVIYKLIENEVIIVKVIEVNKHDYKI